MKNHYYCNTTDHFNTVFSEAINTIPDSLTTDGMITDMGGFQVSLSLYASQLASPPTLIKLTALNNNKNRVKAWGKDMHICFSKPLETKKSFIKPDKVSMYSGLPKNDQLFIDKFFNLIKKMYTDPRFLRPQMATMMAVSDRQLQRKLKALLDKNPIDLLREYRMKKAVEILKNGTQVGIAAYQCGYNSLSYFSKCFKDIHGFSPKFFQQTCHNK
jgi:AraC-like DNA-binding protein